MPLVDRDNPNRTMSDAALRTNRRTLREREAIPMFAPQMHHNQCGRPKFGAPMPLDGAIVAGALDTANGRMRRPEAQVVGRRVRPQQWHP